MHQCIKFILFWNDTLHVSEVFPPIIRSSRLYIQQHAFVKQTDTAVCLLASRQQYLFDIRLFLFVQYWTPDDGRKFLLKVLRCVPQWEYEKHYCADVLFTGWTAGDLIPVGANLFAPVQTDPGAQTASYKMGSVSLSRG